MKKLLMLLTSMLVIACGPAEESFYTSLYDDPQNFYDSGETVFTHIDFAEMSSDKTGDVEVTVRESFTPYHTYLDFVVELKQEVVMLQLSTDSMENIIYSIDPNDTDFSVRFCTGPQLDDWNSDLLSNDSTITRRAIDEGYFLELSSVFPGEEKVTTRFLYRE